MRPEEIYLKHQYTTNSGEENKLDYTVSQTEIYLHIKNILMKKISNYFQSQIYMVGNRMHIEKRCMCAKMVETKTLSHDD